jgi:antitoxin component of MazEF toxin-antitoxin module
MERKLVKQGRNALTVTLPAKWLQAKGLAAGDCVFVDEQNAQLVVRVANRTSRREIELDLTDCERSMAFHAILGKYIEGYDRIVARYSAVKAMQDILQSMTGMVIEEQSPTRIVFKSIISVPEDNVEALLRRACHMLLEQARILERIARRSASFDEIKMQERLLDTNIFYCMRYLNKYENQQHSYRYFLLLTTLELAADEISRIAQFIGKQQALAQGVVKGIEDYTRLLFLHDLKKMYAALRAFRNSIGTKTFADGLAYSLAETLYNYLGYIVGSNEK